MTPRPAWSLAVLLLAVSAHAADIPWGVADKGWVKVAFTDVNGAAQIVYLHENSWFAAAEGGDVPLYSFKALPAQKDHLAFDARLSGFTATADKSGALPTIKISIPHTAMSVRWTIPWKPILPVIKTAPVDNTYVAPKYKLNLPQTEDEPAPTLIKANFPTQGRETAATTVFPENETSREGTPIGLLTVMTKDEWSKSSARDRMLRFFIPFEYGFMNPPLVAALAAVTPQEIESTPEAMTPSQIGDVDAMSAWPPKRRQQIMDKAKAVHAEFSANLTSRPKSFSKLEGEFAWTFANMGGQHAAFVAEVAKANATEKGRVDFVLKYRRFIMAELIRYYNEASPLLKAKGTQEAAWNAYRERLRSGVYKTITDDPAQLKDNGSPVAAPNNGVVSQKVTVPKTKVKTPSGNGLDEYLKD